MRLLPRPKREAMFAVYAYCRAVDDIADGDDTPEVKLAGLTAWREEIDQLFQGRPNHPITRALRRPVETYGLAKEEFLALLDGMEMDATNRMVAPSFSELELYCDRVAGAVGLLSVRIFGVSGPAARPLALTLGRALQLTNLLRDLLEDAELGRLYLPRELLEAHGIETRDPAAVLRHPALAAVCGDLAEIAGERFVDARAALREAVRSAAPKLLEPMMRVEVVTADQYMGDVIGDLNSRRGSITGMEQRGNAQVINAMVPLANMFGYINNLRSMSQGRAQYTMHFDHYEKVPQAVADEVVAKLA